MKRFFTTLILLNLLLSSVDLWSQQDWSWKKHLKAAESALQKKIILRQPFTLSRPGKRKVK
jgi:hypothetical protein